MLKNSDTLSFEDLSTIYRVEKKSPTLSAVRRDLYHAMAGLIISLRSEYEKHLSTDPDSIICEGVNQRRKRAVLMSKEITEIRMGKIASLALIGSRGGQNILDNLTQEEREYYDDILTVSRRHVNIMDRLSGKRKFETHDIDPKPIADKTDVKNEAKEVQIEDEIPDPSIEYSVGSCDPDLTGETHIEEFIIIKILEDMPPFSGPDRNYELFKEDIVRMPKTMATVLINREKAIMINPAP